MLIDAGAHPTIQGGYYTINNGSGIYFGASFNSTADVLGARVRGNQFHGVQIEGAGGCILVQGCRIGGNSVASSGTYHGVSVAPNVNDFKIDFNRIGGDIDLSGTGTQGYAILVNTGTSDNYTILGNSCYGNATGKVADGGTGTNKAVANNI
ncbi:MAG: hypothetical protein CUN54_09525 [Phototrophicales bacterium]|nr:MAG: hypothetical protein CUN54_09525 [Phototrophicales bacterium]